MFRRRFLLDAVSALSSQTSLSNRFLSSLNGF